MEIKKICVIGAGTMGSGIAQVSAQAGYETWMVDLTEELVNRGMGHVKESLSRRVKRGTLETGEMERVLTRLHPATSIRQAAGDADFVIESVFEKVEVKMSVFRELDEACPPQTILGSNTSTIPIALLGSTTRRGERIIGTHFINPAQVMRVVEIVRALLTSEETLKVTVALMKSWGKEVAVVKDSPGFVNNRFCMIIFNEAAKVLAEGLGNLEDIDKLMKLSLNWPMGPFELIDLVGVDVIADALESIYRETGWERYKPAPLLRRMVESGYLGSKVGKGCYTLFGQKVL